MTSMGNTIFADPGDMVSVRTAAPDECRELGLPLWRSKLVFVFTSADGNEVLHPADGVTVKVKPLDAKSN